MGIKLVRSVISSHSSIHILDAKIRNFIPQMVQLSTDKTMVILSSCQHCSGKVRFNSIQLYVSSRLLEIYTSLYPVVERLIQP